MVRVRYSLQRKLIVNHNSDIAAIQFHCKLNTYHLCIMNYCSLLLNMANIFNVATLFRS